MSELHAKLQVLHNANVAKEQEVHQALAVGLEEDADDLVEEATRERNARHLALLATATKHARGLEDQSLLLMESLESLSTAMSDYASDVSRKPMPSADRHGNRVHALTDLNVTINKSIEPLKSATGALNCIHSTAAMVAATAKDPDFYHFHKMTRPPLAFVPSSDCMAVNLLCRMTGLLGRPAGPIAAFQRMMANNPSDARVLARSIPALHAHADFITLGDFTESSVMDLATMSDAVYANVIKKHMPPPQVPPGYISLGEYTKKYAREVFMGGYSDEAPDDNVTATAFVQFNSPGVGPDVIDGSMDGLDEAVNGMYPDPTRKLSSNDYEEGGPTFRMDESLMFLWAAWATHSYDERDVCYRHTYSQGHHALRVLWNAMTAYANSFDGETVQDATFSSSKDGSSSDNDEPPPKPVQPRFGNNPGIHWFVLFMLSSGRTSSIEDAEAMQDKFDMHVSEEIIRHMQMGETESESVFKSTIGASNSDSL